MNELYTSLSKCYWFELSFSGIWVNVEDPLAPNSPDKPNPVEPGSVGVLAPLGLQ
jgi:hypothetical protein